MREILVEAAQVYAFSPLRWASIESIDISEVLITFIRQKSSSIV